MQPQLVAAEHYASAELAVAPDVAAEPVIVDSVVAEAGWGAAAVFVVEAWLEAAAAAAAVVVVAVELAVRPVIVAMAVVVVAIAVSEHVAERYSHFGDLVLQPSGMEVLTAVVALVEVGCFHPGLRLAV